MTATVNQTPILVGAVVGSLLLLLLLLLIVLVVLVTKKRRRQHDLLAELHVSQPAPHADVNSTEYQAISAQLPPPSDYASGNID